MFVLRSAKQEDLKALINLSEIVFFISLPNDPDMIKAKISNSINSFTNPHKDKAKNKYIFVLEDIATKKIAGISMIHAKHGTETEPHFYLKVDQEHKYSSTINTGFVHGTLKLGLDTNGPSEIGGLVLHPEYRKNSEKLGKQLSFIRFLYMAKHPDQFEETVLSELMPPLDKKGNSPLWEAIGRRFMNMNYLEADKLSRDNKEFITSLYPSENIYQTLLPMEARNAIGKVGKETEPVKRMLEKIGFKYSSEVDPFDGGPHYKAKLNDINVVKTFRNFTKSQKTNESYPEEFLVQVPSKEHSFYALKVAGKIVGECFEYNCPDSIKIDENASISVVEFN